MKAVGYCRVSTSDQATHGLSLESQQEKIETYCRLRDLELVEVIVDMVEDQSGNGRHKGVSARKTPLKDRKGGKRLLAMLDKRQADAVVMLKLDRGWRDGEDCLHWVNRWKRKGVSLHFTDLGGNSIDSQTAVGMFIITILAGAAELEGSLASERTRAAMAVKLARGELRSGTDAPYGYRLEGTGRYNRREREIMALIPVEEEQEVIQQMIAAHDSGVSYDMIAKMLNGHGLKPRKAPKWRAVQVMRACDRERKSPKADSPHLG